MRIVAPRDLDFLCYFVEALLQAVTVTSMNPKDPGIGRPLMKAVAVFNRELRLPSFASDYKENMTLVNVTRLRRCPLGRGVLLSH